jgi:hypothetical protein
VLAALAATPALAEILFPDLRGTWKGESESIITETGTLTTPNSRRVRQSSAAFRSQ